VLAGDTMRSAADLHLPMVGVTLASRAGYFKQTIVHGAQIEEPDHWQPDKWASLLAAKVAVRIGEREVWVGAWLYVAEGHRGGAVPVVLLDTDLPENHNEDRKLTDFLYGGDQTYRFKQEMVLGIGGVRMLAALGFDISKYHLNEGHAAFLTLELLRRYAHSRRGGNGLHYDEYAVMQRCVFTTHTPIEAGHDQFPYDLADRLLNDIVDGSVLRQFAGEDRLNMTRLALNLSEHVNGVARRHAEVSRRMFPGYDVAAVTNGVHPWTWACDSMRALYDEYLPRWCHEPELFMRVARIPDEALREAHSVAKRALLELVRHSGGPAMDSALPVLGFARRMTAYKRADLLFTDVERLKAIAREHPFQIVLAGKAHPHDVPGRALIERLHRYADELAEVVPIAFLPNYNMDVARVLVSGADVWLNTPMRPLEASGTSGMKAALNGVPNLSVPDGWWLEGWIEGITGWAIGGDADSDNSRDAVALYNKLERDVLPLYYGDPAHWTAVMKGAIGLNASYFNSHRMMRRYAVEAYLG
ncbi:MAG TPA: alpha-glucan family phosphorylase, partial [Burkholderiales bacterium]|nr:alpha-glucan family phosphorylase [Burkholderiales bacterium]